MNIQSGTYYWPDTFPDPPAYPALHENIACDVLIVGGGSSGAQCAYYLADQPLKVVVVEKGKIGSGSTSTNTALIQYSGEKMFTNLIHSFGEGYTRRHLDLLHRAIDEIEAAASRTRLDFEFCRRDTLYCASCTEDVAPLHEEYELLRRLGCDLEFWSQEQIEAHYPFSREAAIYSRKDAELNPFKFTHALLDYAAEHGVRIYEHTEVNGHYYEDGHRLVVMTTKDGFTITARQVIFAAGYEGIEIQKDKQVSFVSTYTVTTSPITDLSSWYHRTLIWETARPYIYMRTTADNRIIIGGLDENTDYPEVRDRKLVHKADKLMEELTKRFPDLGQDVRAEYALASFYGGTADGMPIIGRYEKYPNCYFLFAFGDNGTVYSQALSRLIAKEVAGAHDPDLQLYLAERPLLQQPAGLPVS